MNAQGLLYPESNDPLALAEYLILWGVPVFSESPPYLQADMGKKFRHNDNWPETLPRMSNLDRVRESTRPRKHALCACTGAGFEVLDFDKQNGGMESYRKMKDMGILPPTYGQFQTPSLGYHLYTPVTGLRSIRLRKIGLPGVDIQARGTFVYIYPTVKYGKIEKDVYFDYLGTYVQKSRVDMEKLRANADHPQMKIWKDWLENEAGAKSSYEPKADPKTLWPAGRVHDSRERRYLEKALEGARTELRNCPPGTSNDTMNTACLKLGGLIAGCGLSEAEAYSVMMEAAHARRAENPEFYVPRGFDHGKSKPKSFPWLDADGKETPESVAEREEWRKKQRELEHTSIEEEDNFLAEWLAKQDLEGGE